MRFFSNHACSQFIVLRLYVLHEQDYENLSRFTAIFHCIIAGLLADEYFLLHLPPNRRRPPLLPSLLPELFQGEAADVLLETVQYVDGFYQNLYAALATEEAGWLPELQLDMALSAAALPDKSWAKQYMLDSARLWMEQPGAGDLQRGRCFL